MCWVNEHNLTFHKLQNVYSDAKKICKKLKISPDSYILKHYKNGEFNRDYDRKFTVSSMVNFMRDPTGDLPWEEDATASDITHIPDAEVCNPPMVFFVQMEF